MGGADHVLTDLRLRFDEVLAQLESVAGWKTARVQRPDRRRTAGRSATRCWCDRGNGQAVLIPAASPR
ncbi:hypothetical protein CCZ27_09165 [Thauera sinica]|nr:hypothetical protein CCZ27_09165 [Thauera sp. K11]